MGSAAFMAFQLGDHADLTVGLAHDPEISDYNLRITSTDGQQFTLSARSLGHLVALGSAIVTLGSFGDVSCEDPSTCDDGHTIQSDESVHALVVHACEPSGKEATRKRKKPPVPSVFKDAFSEKDDAKADGASE